MVFKRGWSVFWVLYAFFFAVPFPMILYYNIYYSGGGDRHIFSLSSPYWALTYLAVSVICWIWLLARYFQRWFVQPARARHQTIRLLTTGAVRDAEIIASKEVGKPVKGAPQLEITLHFDNLSGVPIRKTLSIADMRPQLGRFVVGRHVRLRINKMPTKGPAVAIDGAEFHPDYTRWGFAFLGWLLLLGAVLGYYILSYHFENQGMGWRFLSFFHPLVICPLALLALHWVMGGGFRTLFTDNRDALRLKYEGDRAEARLLDAKETGTYVNEQALVHFELEYEDRQGTSHRTSLKRIVSRLETNIVHAKTIPIFYLAQEPQKIIFATDLEDTA